MRYLYYLVFVSSLMFITGSYVSAEPVSSHCYTLSNTNVITKGQPFDIKYSLELKPKFLVEPLPGFIKDSGGEKKNGVFIFPNNINLTLIGSDDTGGKKFIMQFNKKVQFIEHEPSIIDLTYTPVHHHVRGGVLDEKIWNLHSLLINKAVSEAAAPVIIRFLPMQEKCIQYDACIAPLGYDCDDNMDLPKYEEAPSKKISDIGAFSKNTDVPRKFISPRKGKEKTGKTLTSLLARSHESGIHEHTSSPPKAKNLKAIGTSSRTYTTESTISKVCDIKGRTLDGLPFDLESNPVTIVGLLNNKKKAQAYWFDTSVSSEPSKLKLNFNLTSLIDSYVSVEVLLRKYQTKKSKTVFPVRFTGLAKAPRESKEPLKKPSSEQAMNILVVGDASSVAISGLKEMETLLVKNSKGMISWKIDWRNISADGKWLSSKVFTSFNDLISHTISSRKKGFKVLLNDEKSFEYFIKQFEETLLKSKQSFDFVIWIKDGYQVPLVTPDLLGDFFTKVHEKGRIPRFDNGNPRKWLYILSGSMPGGSKTLLEEPMNRARPNPGQIDEEKTGSKPRRLLNRPQRLALSLQLAGKQYAKKASAEPDIDTDNLAVNAKKVFESLGFLISLKEINKEKVKLKVNRLYGDDLVTTINQKSDVAIKENCTHIYLKSNEIGLNWLD